MIRLKKLTNPGFSLFLLLLIFLPALVHGRVFDKVVAKVNTEIITLSSVEDRAEILRQKYSGELEEISKKDLMKEALNMIVEELLQIQEGKKLGFIVDEEAIDAAMADISHKNGLAEGQLEIMLEREGRTLKSYRDHIRDQILVTKISRFEIGSRINISQKEIIRFYRQNQKEFWEDGKVRARHILFIVDPDSSENNINEKLRLAKAVLDKIRKGGDFSKLAREYSEDVSASNGGDLGIVGRGKMVPEFEDTIFNLKSGEVSDIVRTEYGYHIIKVDEVLPGRTIPLVEVKDRIQQVLTAQKQKEVYSGWIGELKKTAYIEVTLFDEPKKDFGITSKDLEDQKSLEKRKKSSRQALQKKWEEMYKSVEKSKKKLKFNADRERDSLELKLQRIKKLHDQKRISRQEYEKRKTELLNRF